MQAMARRERRSMPQTGLRFVPAGKLRLQGRTCFEWTGNVPTGTADEEMKSPAVVSRGFFVEVFGSGDNAKKRCYLAILEREGSGKEA